MKHLLFLSFLTQFACLDLLKLEEEEEENKDNDKDNDNDNSAPKEGSQLGDCYDGEDNDDDGAIDCEDSGCFDKPVCNETGFVPDEDTAIEDLPPDAAASVTWGDSSVTLALTVENGLDGAAYYWGIAETNNCTDCWTGEDCFWGYSLSSGDVLDYCHPIDADGGELLYGGDPWSLNEGSETLFYDDSFSDQSTYLVDDRGSADGPCWVWGADPSYYYGYAKSCTEM